METGQRIKEKVGKCFVVGVEVKEVEREKKKGEEERRVGG